MPAEYAGYSAAAVARNTLCAPGRVIDGGIAWGQDRLAFVLRALAG